MSPTKTTSLILLLIALAALALAIFWYRPPVAPSITTSSHTKVRVLTTFFPLYDFTRNIGKDRIALDILFTQTPEVASFRAGDIQKINQAQLLIKNGAGLEPVVDDLIKSSDNKNIVVVDTSQGIPILGSGGEVGAGNPHIWLDPLNAIKQVETIRDALVSADPPNTPFYQDNAAAYIEQLKALDQEIRTSLATVSRRDFVAFHDAFVYFAQRYGLHQAAVIEEFPGKEPSPQYLAHVITTIKQLGITVIFSEPQFSPKVVEAIAHDLHVQVQVLDPIETGNLETDSYLSLMRKNLQTLVETLR